MMPLFVYYGIAFRAGPRRVPRAFIFCRLSSRQRFCTCTYLFSRFLRLVLLHIFSAFVVSTSPCQLFFYVSCMYVHRAWIGPPSSCISVTSLGYTPCLFAFFVVCTTGFVSARCTSGFGLDSYTVCRLFVVFDVPQTYAGTLN